MSVVNGNLTIAGQLFVQQSGGVLPGASVGDAQCNGSSPITAQKLYHQYMPKWSQPYGSSATSERRGIYISRAAGTLVDFKVTNIVAATGPDTVTVDLYANGASVLAAPVTLSSSTAAFSINAPTIMTSAYAAGTVFEVVITTNHTSGTLPQGIMAEPVFRETSGT